MKKIFIITAVAAVFGNSVNAAPFANRVDSTTIYNEEVREDELDRLIQLQVEPLSPQYTDYVEFAKWDTQWFLGGAIGNNAFIGNPKGCGDFFDRTTFGFNLYAGKWITPTVGVRVQWQGAKYKNSELQSENYWALHGDFMVNIAQYFRAPENNFPKWNLAPYVGIGFAKGTDIITTYNDNGNWNTGSVKHYPFALTYGVYASYRFNERMNITGEIGVLNTINNFDGNGAGNKFSDRILSYSIGLGVTIGKTRWKRAIDAMPYINQNDILMLNLDHKRESKKRVDNQDSFEQGGRRKYSGLIQLQERMMRAMKLEQLMIQDSINKSKEYYTNADSIAKLYNAPIYFFFKINTTKLRDKDQMRNIDELAKIAKEHNLIVAIQGAADKGTGTRRGNNRLAAKRTRYIAKLLKNRGVKTEQLRGTSLGGINEHPDNPSADRRVKVELKFNNNK